MARPESIAVGGFYAAPEELLPSIAALVHVRKDGEHAIVDPCAGEGVALATLAKSWLDLREDDYRLYACELEETRARACEHLIRQETRSGRGTVAKGDAFRLQWGDSQWTKGHGATMLWLNSPYDIDHELGRWEERWLRRFAPAVAIGGVLLFFVPFYALATSAATIATNFQEVSCWRVPEPHFYGFKQVLLVARRRPALLAPDPVVESHVRAWSGDASIIPELPLAGPAVIEVSGQEDAGFGRWEIAPLDVRGLLGRLQPWHATDRGGRLAPIPGVLPLGAFDELLAPVFPLACPPKPAHIAAGIASGALSGARLEPDDSEIGLPSLLVKGTFRKRFRTVDHRTNKDGDVTAEIQVQHPELDITALDIRRGTYHRLTSDVAVTGACDVAAMTAGDLLASYGRSLLRTLRDRCPAGYDPARAADVVALPKLPRELFGAQEHAVRAVCMLLDRPDKAAVVLGEIGSGKTTVALATAAARGARRVLVFCPPHLLKSWTDQALAVVPWARTVVLDDVRDVDAFAADTSDGVMIAILSRETAKLGHAWKGISGRCPRCGVVIVASADENARKRLRCEHTEMVAEGRAARMAERLAALLAPVLPDRPSVRQLIRGRIAQRFLDIQAQRVAAGADPWPAARARLAPFARRVGIWIQQAKSEPEAAALASLAHLLHAAADEALTAQVARGIFLGSLDDRAAYGRGAKLRESAREMMLLLQPNGAAQVGLAMELRHHEVKDDGYSSGATWRRWQNHVDAMVSGRNGEYGWRAYRYQDGRVYLEKLQAGSAEAAHTALEKLTAHGRFVESDPCGEPLFQAVPRPRRVPLAQYIAKRHPRAFDLVVVDECFVAGTVVSGRPIESIRVGDHVVAFDERNSTFAQRAVVRLFRKRPALLVRLQVRGCEPIFCTPNHQFFTRRGWVAAGLLTQTDEVLRGERMHEVQSGDAEWAFVDGLEILEPGRDGTFGGVCSDGFVYNVEVDELHTYVANGVVVHNCHEAGNQDSAQSLAAQQLFELHRPTIALTGSVMNGYASSLFIQLWSLSAAFRAEFARADLGEFVRRYGYLKQIVEMREKDGKKPVNFGAVTDRVERVERTSGQAPGVLPALLLRHLLPISVTLHVDDLGIDLPPAEELVEMVEPGPVLGPRYASLQSALLQQIKRDRFSDRAGQLFGQLSELPSYLDRATADVGNTDVGAYQVRYPDGQVVAEHAGLPAETLLPKEDWLIDVVRRELAEGRNVIVFPWHTELMPRISRLLEEATGEKAPILWAGKVAPKNREDWIDREIVASGRRLLVVNPVAVQTGLNNLVNFASEVWLENPACNPLIRRQAIGRVRRIGQRLQTRIFTPIYKGTIQEVMHQLLLHKVSVSEAADGLDATAALQASGVGVADELAGRDIGKVLYEMLTRGEAEAENAATTKPTRAAERAPKQASMGW